MKFIKSKTKQYQIKSNKIKEAYYEKSKEKRSEAVKCSYGSWNDGWNGSSGSSRGRVHKYLGI